jgi:hypothetical protein
MKPIAAPVLARALAGESEFVPPRRRVRASKEGGLRRLARAGAAVLRRRPSTSAPQPAEL